MTRNYYTLVAGLREYSFELDKTFESEKRGFDAVAIIDEIASQLHKTDREYLRLFYMFYDIGNIINIMAGRGQFSALGNYSPQQLKQYINDPQGDDHAEGLPGWLERVLTAYKDPANPEYDEVDRTVALEKALFEAYYEQCAASRNRYIREWYDFDRNLRNVMAAYGARKAKLPIAQETVGGGYVVETLGRSSAADFGLRGELDYIDEVTDVMTNEENFVEKERRLDMIRWRMSEELTPFDYFDMNALLAYLSRVNILYRWMALDPAYGREMFERLMGDMEYKL